MAPTVFTVTGAGARLLAADIGVRMISTALELKVGVITAIIGALVFGQRIRPVGWLGILLVVCGVVSLKLV